MLFDIGLVIACHFITANLALLSPQVPPSRSKVVRSAATVTVLVGIAAIIDMTARLFLGSR